ncbi:MAG TPA: tRNA lysidine(34) synthetase TilS [Flavobacterium sp.]|jgi:tRNA(Ile)-lysidine synthase
MFEKFQNHIQKNFPSLSDKKLLLAVSGGIDSMVMVELFSRLNFNISIAHCNFNLRGKESDEDAAFVYKIAEREKIVCFQTSFNTAAYASDHKLSIQVAARQLRYLWFDELLHEYQLDFLLTAHHADDSLETFLINFSRGTGLDGLTGIPEKNGKILRPLLPFSRAEVVKYATDNNIEWREDSSNSSEKYLRNKLRHSVIPQLKDLNVGFLPSFSETIKSLQQAQSMVEDASVLIYKQVVIQKESKIIFKIFELKKLPNYSAYLHHWLKDFGFTAWQDIYDLPDAQSGKCIYSADFLLLKDREILILERRQPDEQSQYEILDDSSQLSDPINLQIESVPEIHQPDENCIFVDANKISFPLILRKWEEGDHFFPFGMSGSKKLSKYFKDMKIPVTDKSKIWILASDNNIVWVVGYRADDRFKITAETSRLLKISYIP